MFNLTAEEKLKRARIKLQKENPFFGYLVLHLNLVEKSDEVPTAAVDYSGNMYFNEEFVNGLSPEKIKGLVAHEVMHLALEGKMRKGSRQHKKWNVAQDIVINHILQQNGFELPEGGLNPRRGEIEIPYPDGAVKITGLDDHNFESVYNELKDHDEDGDGPGPEGYDEPVIETDEDGGFPLEGGGGQKGDDQDWGRIRRKAASHAKSQGKLPHGMDDEIEAIEDGKADWRSILHRFITEAIPNDTTFARPSRLTRTLRSQGVNTFLPDDDSEGLDVYIALDTSGSISRNELQDFVDEVAGIIGGFAEVNITMILHTADVYHTVRLENASVEEVNDALDIKTGGTDHRPVFEWIENNANGRSQVLVSFTDGYTTVPEEVPGIDTVWVINNHDIGIEQLKFGEVVNVLHEDWA